MRYFLVGGGNGAAGEARHILAFGEAENADIPERAYLLAVDTDAEPMCAIFHQPNIFILGEFGQFADWARLAEQMGCQHRAGSVADASEKCSGPALRVCGSTSQNTGL